MCVVQKEVKGKGFVEYPFINVSVRISADAVFNEVYKLYNRQIHTGIQFYIFCLRICGCNGAVRRYA